MIWWVIGAAGVAAFFSLVLFVWEAELGNMQRVLTHALLAAIAMLLWFIAKRSGR